MTTRIPARFARCAAEGRPALVTYTMAGDPDLATAQAILDALPQRMERIQLREKFVDEKLPYATGLLASSVRSEMYLQAEQPIIFALNEKCAKQVRMLAAGLPKVC